MKLLYYVFSMLSGVIVASDNALSRESLEIISPNQKYTLIAPSRSDSIKIVNTKTQKVLKTIPTGRSYNSEDVSGVWSKDSSTLVWSELGKWGPIDLMAIEVKDGGKFAQTNILKTVQEGILVKLREADPQLFKNISNAITGDDSAYLSGFTIDVRIVPSEDAGWVSFWIGLTSDPNYSEPKNMQLQADMNGDVEKGRVSFHEFKIYRPLEIAQIDKEHADAIDAENAIYNQTAHLLSGARRRSLEKREAQWKAMVNGRSRREGFSFTGVRWLTVEASLYRQRSAELRLMLRPEGGRSTEIGNGKP